MKLWGSLLGLIVISILITLVSKQYDIDDPFYQTNCIEINKREHTETTKDKCQSFSLMSVRFFHYLITLFLCGYLFLFDSKFDYLYVLFFCFLLLHWMVFDKCFLSSYEFDLIKQNNKTEHEQKKQNNKIKDKEELHKPVSITHPHLDIFFGKKTDWFILFQGSMMTITITVIFWRWRLFSKHPLYKGFMWFGLVSLQLFLMLKDRIKITL